MHTSKLFKQYILNFEYVLHYKYFDYNPKQKHIHRRINLHNVLYIKRRRMIFWNIINPVCSKRTDCESIWSRLMYVYMCNRLKR